MLSPIFHYKNIYQEWLNWSLQVMKFVIHTVDRSTNRLFIVCRSNIYVYTILTVLYSLSNKKAFNIRLSRWFLFCKILLRYVNYYLNWIHLRKQFRWNSTTFLDILLTFTHFFFRAMASRLAPTITLNNGRKMPQLGLGTWLVSMR